MLRTGGDISLVRRSGGIINKVIKVPGRGKLLQGPLYVVCRHDWQRVIYKNLKKSAQLNNILDARMLTPVLQDSITLT